MGWIPDSINLRHELFEIGTSLELIILAILYLRPGDWCGCLAQYHYTQQHSTTKSSVEIEIVVRSGTTILLRSYIYLLAFQINIPTRIP